jgi:L-rhamnose mutarotase
MARYCFLLRVRPEHMDEYRRRHADVWPEMLAAMAGTEVNARWRTSSAA